MAEQAAVAGGGGNRERKKHAFWDTQVSGLVRNLVLWNFVLLFCLMKPLSALSNVTHSFPCQHAHDLPCPSTAHAQLGRQWQQIQKNKAKNGSDEPNNNSGYGLTLDGLNRRGPIIPDRDPSELCQDPYNMPKGFKWSEVNIANPAQWGEVYDLLYQNYVKDDKCMFRFTYSSKFLTWVLTLPGYVN